VVTPDEGQPTLVTGYLLYPFAESFDCFTLLALKVVVTCLGRNNFMVLLIWPPRQPREAVHLFTRLGFQRQQSTFKCG